MAATVRDIAGYADARLIGRGGFGAVYRATDDAHGRDVAIKVLPGSLDEAERRRFDRERQTMGRLGAHPNIIPVYESGYTDGGEGYIVMEMANGGSLRDRLGSGPIPWHEAATVMASVADASQAAHDYGVLHRDIKPDNILIDQFGNPKLSDFGIAAVASNATATTSTTATLAHAAPELLQGQPSTASIDIYAIGSTLHALITGRPPFLRPGDENVTPMITRALTEPPPDLRPYGVPDGLAGVIDRALAKSPDDRFATAAELGAALRAGAAGQLPAAGAGFGPGGVPVGGPGSTTAPQARIADGGPLPPAGVPTVTGLPTPGHQPANSPNPSNPSNQPVPAQFTGGDGGPQAPPGQQGYGFQATGPPTRPPGSGPPLPPQSYSVSGQLPSVGGSGAAAYAAPSASSGGSKGRIGLIVGAVLLLLGGAGALALIANRGSDTDPPASSTTSETTDVTSGSSSTETTSEPPSTTDASTSSTSPTTALSANQPTVEVDCPSEIVLGVKIFCSIFTTNAVSGEWHLPAFLTAPEPIEVVPGEYEIFVEPTNPEAVGRTFTITATVTGDDGTTARVNHSFTVVGVLVEINCPDQISLNSSIVCDIVSTNAVEGEWDIPGFGSAPLEVVPGSNPIFIEPNDPASLGQRYTITATVRDADGVSSTAMSDFIVTPADS